MTPRELIRLTSSLFRQAGIPDPVNDASVLLSHLTGKPPLELRLDSDTELGAAVLNAYRRLSEHRLNRTPLQYMLGEAPFCGRMFTVDPRVLIPRPETELLCEWSLEIIRDGSVRQVLDLCCGSGCIGITLKAEAPSCSVTLSDISPDALCVAAANADRHAQDVSFARSDLLSEFPDFSFDMIVSNPPYIPSDVCNSLQPEVLMEPRLALDGGADGCDLYRRITEEAYPVLSSGGRLLMELGAGESQLVSSLLDKQGYSGIQIRKDYSGQDRMILAVKP